MSAFLVNGGLVTDKTAIRNMWADHFEALGTPSANLNFDNDFAVRVSTLVEEKFSNTGFTIPWEY